MKKIYVLPFILTFIACATPEIENEQFAVKNVAKVTDNKITENNLYDLQNILIDEYYQKHSYNNQDLENVITDLVSITSSNIEFQNLKVINYSIPSSTEINSLNNNYATIYENLEISINCKTILTLLINEEINLNTLESNVSEANINLSEKELLYFIAHNIKDKNDPEWSKGKTVFIVNGYLNQPASAVFNACLFEIINN